MRGQVAPDTLRLLRRLDACDALSGRRPALTHVSFLLPCDPEDPTAAEAMVEHTGETAQRWAEWRGSASRGRGARCAAGGGSCHPCPTHPSHAASTTTPPPSTGHMFLSNRGKPAAWQAARGQLTPHSAAALQARVHRGFGQVHMPTVGSARGSGAVRFSLTCAALPPTHTQLAIQHLLATSTAAAVLPPCRLACADGAVGGAHDSGRCLVGWVGAKACSLVRQAAAAG